MKIKDINNIDEERFWSLVNKTLECWEWVGTLSTKGYGETHQNGKTYFSHRVAYTLLIGSIPKGLTLDHLCKNTRCVNPAHLEPVTLKENIRRSDCVSAVNARKTHCKIGHKFDEKNTYIRLQGGRDCRKCKVIKHMKWLKRSREPGYISTKPKKHLPEAK